MPSPPTEGGGRAKKAASRVKEAASRAKKPASRAKKPAAAKTPAQLRHLDRAALEQRARALGIVLTQRGRPRSQESLAKAIYYKTHKKM